MKRFAALFAAIDHTTSTNAKVEAMVAYFSISAGGRHGMGRRSS